MTIEQLINELGNIAEVVGYDATVRVKPDRSLSYILWGLVVAFIVLNFASHAGVLN